MTDKPAKHSASYLSPPDFHRLNWACRPITEAFGEPPYLVGSALTRPDFRDIDLRLILDDDAVTRMFGTGAFGVHGEGDPAAVRLLLNIALSDLITKAANPPAPIDFQIQSVTEANVPEHGMRNPMGMRRTPYRIEVAEVRDVTEDALWEDPDVVRVKALAYLESGGGRYTIHERSSDGRWLFQPLPPADGEVHT